MVCFKAAPYGIAVVRVLHRRMDAPRHVQNTGSAGQARGRIVAFNWPRSLPQSSLGALPGLRQRAPEQIQLQVLARIGDHRLWWVLSG